MRIGEALSAARARAGIELAGAEERTKIRARYLRALENESWDELPSHAYAKGYLRSYAELLGIDAEMLVDEYRRQVESAEPPAGPRRADRVLESGQHRPPPGAPAAGPGRAMLIGLGALGTIAVMVGVGVLVDGEEDDEPAARQQGKGRPGFAEREQRGAREAKPVTLGLAIAAAVEVCLLGEDDVALIDGQVLAAGTRDEYRGKRFELRFPAGFRPDQVRLSLDGNRRTLPRIRGPAAFRVVGPARIREAPPPGRSCP
jgi:hypothetical protein